MNHTTPDSLVRYQKALEEALGREIAGAADRHRRLVGVHLVLACGAAAVVVLVALNLLLGGASTPSPAEAATIRHAAAAISEAPGTILQVKFTATQDNGDGTTVSWTQESFDEQQAPYNSRMINVQLPGAPSGVEQATVNGVPQVYDPTRNTIYLGPPASNAVAQLSRTAPNYTFSAGPVPGSYDVRVAIKFVTFSRLAKRLSAKSASIKMGRGGTALVTLYRTIVVTAAQAKLLHSGTAVIRWTIHRFQVSNPRVVQAPRPSHNAADADPSSATFRAQILALLGSHQARVVGHATVRGRDTIEIQSGDGHITYYVTPDDYTPVELTTKGTSGDTVMRFDTYRYLPLGSNNDLLSLAAQHPTAKIDRNATDYQAADLRLFPRG